MQAGDAQRAGEGRLDLAEDELVASLVPLLQLAGHVVEHVDDDVVARRGVAGQRARGRRREQRTQLALAAEVGRGVGGEQRARGEDVLADLPVAADAQHQRVAHEGGRGVARDVELHQLVALQQEELLVIEVDRAREQRALVAGRAVHRDVGGHVLLLRLEHRHRLGQRRAALPALDDARIARVGHRAGAEVGRDVHRVLVDPVDAGLGFGQREAVRDEALGDHVELAHHLRIGAAARQRDEAAAVLRPEAAAAAPDPVLALGLAQRVEVDHRFPGRLGLAVLGQRGAPPQAALVLVVLPQVVEPVALAREERDAVLGVQHLQHLCADRRVLGPRGQLLLRRGIALAHPVQRLLALHVLQPQVGVVLGRGRDRCGLGHGGVAGKREEGREPMGGAAEEGRGSHGQQAVRRAGIGSLDGASCSTSRRSSAAPP